MEYNETFDVKSGENKFHIVLKNGIKLNLRETVTEDITNEEFSNVDYEEKTGKFYFKESMIFINCYFFNTSKILNENAQYFSKSETNKK